MLGEEVAYATFPSHISVLLDIQAQCYSPLRLLYSDFGDFSNGVCHVNKIIIAKSNPDIELLTQQTFCVSHSILLADTKIIMIMDV